MVSKKEYQARRVAAGMCGNCGCRTLKKGCTRCVHCMREKTLTYMDLKNSRREAGLCPECGKKRVPNRWACHKHLEMRRKATQRYKDRKRATNAVS